MIRGFIVISGVLDAMAGAGLAPAKPIDLQPDGKIHRYRVAGDKGGSTNGWFVLHGGPVAFGAFGSWKTSESHTWREATTKPLTAAERAEIDRHTQAMRQAHAQEREAVQAAARAKAQRLWRTAKPALDSHPYLVKKRILGFGARQLRDMLLIPARNVSGELQTLQFIGADGSKRFLTGGRISGCYCPIGCVSDTLLLAEGFATAATLHLATGHATAACFSCGNLLDVARALRSKFPQLRLILCADNDSKTPGNPGLTKAREAARAVGGWLAVPKFKHEDPLCTQTH